MSKKYQGPDGIVALVESFLRDDAAGGMEVLELVGRDGSVSRAALILVRLPCTSDLAIGITGAALSELTAAGLVPREAGASRGRHHRPRVHREELGTDAQ